jgi:arabinofuranosyltransferase
LNQQLNGLKTNQRIGNAKIVLIQAMKKNTLVYIVLILATLAACVGGFCRYHDYYHDDAYIYLRYVNNFLNGQGLVWNAGERVEGYTNFLQVILVSILGRAGVDLIKASRLVGIGAFLALIAFLFSITRQRFIRKKSERIIATIPLIIVVSSAPIIIWTIGGLETTLFCLLCTAGLLLSATVPDSGIRTAALSGLFLALASLTRPEGAIFFAVTAAFFLITAITAKSITIKQVIVFAAVYIILYAPFTIWQLIYYGTPFPNTWYAKGNFYRLKAEQGLIYLRDFARSLPYLGLLLLAGLIYASLKRTWSRPLLLLILNIVVYIGYIVYVGGDHMPGFRFMAPIIPICAVALFLTLRDNESLGPKWTGTVITAAITILTGLQIIFPPQRVNYARIPDGAGFLGRIVGQYINETWPKGSLVALNTAGSTPYFAPDMRFIDMLGLNDSHIARREMSSLPAHFQGVPGHEKGDGRYVSSRKPDYIIAGPSNGFYMAESWFLSEYEMNEIPEFYDDYQLETVILRADYWDGFYNYKESEAGKLRFMYYRRMR